MSIVEQYHRYCSWFNLWISLCSSPHLRSWLFLLEKKKIIGKEDDENDFIE